MVAERCGWRGERKDGERTGGRGSKAGGAARRGASGQCWFVARSGSALTRFGWSGASKSWRTSTSELAQEETTPQLRSHALLGGFDGAQLLLHPHNDYCQLERTRSTRCEACRHPRSPPRPRQRRQRRHTPRAAAWAGEGCMLMPDGPSGGSSEAGSADAAATTSSTTRRLCFARPQMACSTRQAFKATLLCLLRLMLAEQGEREPPFP